MNINERVIQLENKDYVNELKKQSERIKFLEDIIENKLGFYIPRRL